MKIWLVIFSAVAMINMVSLAIILILKKPDCKKNRLLSFILLIPAYSILLNTLRYMEVFKDFSYLITLDYLTAYLWPVLIFIYVKLMIGENIILRKKNLLHFIPFSLIAVFLIALWIYPNARSHLNQVQTYDNLTLTNILEIPFMVLSLTYLFICRRMILKHNQVSKESVSKLHPVSLNWLQTFMETLIFIILIVSIAAFVLPLVEYFLLFQTIASTIPFFYLLFKLMSSEHLFSEKEHDLLSQIFVQKKALFPPAEDEKLKIKINKSFILIDLKEILFIKSEEKYTRVYLKDKSYLSDYSLNDFEKKYGSQFIRIHRNTLASLSQIKGIEKFTGGKLHVLMEDGSSLDVSRRMMETVKNLFSIK